MTKNILMVGGVAIVGYLLYKKYGNKPTSTSRGTGTSSFTADGDFFSVSGTGRARMGGIKSGGSDICGEGCVNGKCRFPVYDANGNVTYLTTTCTGTGESGYGTTILQGRR